MSKHCSEAPRILKVKVLDVEKLNKPYKHYVYVTRVTYDPCVHSVIYRTYEEFYRLQKRLSKAFPVASGKQEGCEKILPTLLGKVFIKNPQTQEIARKRLYPLQQYCQALLALPDYISQSTTVAQFFTATQEDISYCTQNQVQDDCSENLPVKVVERSGKDIDISSPVDLDEYRVLEDYAIPIKSSSNGGKASTPKTIPANTLVKILEKRDTGWWYVFTADERTIQTWIPRSNLEPCSNVDEELITWTSDNGPGKLYICTQSYTKQNQDELDLIKGAYVKVLEKSLDGWWLVEHQGEKRRAPGCYLLKCDTLRARRFTGSLSSLVGLPSDFNSTSENSVAHLPEVLETSKSGLSPNFPPDFHINREEVRLKILKNREDHDTMRLSRDQIELEEFLEKKDFLSSGMYSSSVEDSLSSDSGDEIDENNNLLVEEQLRLMQDVGFLADKRITSEGLINHCRSEMNEQNEFKDHTGISEQDRNEMILVPSSSSSEYYINDITGIGLGENDKTDRRKMDIKSPIFQFSVSTEETSEELEAGAASSNCDSPAYETKYLYMIEAELFADGNPKHITQHLSPAGDYRSSTNSLNSSQNTLSTVSYKNGIKSKLLRHLHKNSASSVIGDMKPRSLCDIPAAALNSGPPGTLSHTASESDFFNVEPRTRSTSYAGSLKHSIGKCLKRMSSVNLRRSQNDITKTTEQN